MTDPQHIDVPDEAVEALRLALVGQGWADANARAATGLPPGRKPTNEQMRDARLAINHELKLALRAAAPAIRKQGWIDGAPLVQIEEKPCQ